MGAYKESLGTELCNSQILLSNSVTQQELTIEFSWCQLVSFNQNEIASKTQHNYRKLITFSSRKLLRAKSSAVLMYPKLWYRIQTLIVRLFWRGIRIIDEFLVTQ